MDRFSSRHFFPNHTHNYRFSLFILIGFDLSRKYCARWTRGASAETRGPPAGLEARTTIDFPFLIHSVNAKTAMTCIPLASAHAPPPSSDPPTSMFLGGRLSTDAHAKINLVMRIDEMHKDFEVPHKTLDWTGVYLLRWAIAFCNCVSQIHIRCIRHYRATVNDICTCPPFAARFGASVRKAKSLVEQGLVQLPGRPVYVRSAQLSTEHCADVNFKICCRAHQVPLDRMALASSNHSHYEPP